MQKRMARVGLKVGEFRGRLAVGSLCLLGLAVAMGGCEQAVESADGSGGLGQASGGKGSSTSGGADGSGGKPQSGGGRSSGGAQATGGLSSGASAGEGGAGGEGGSHPGALCELPFEVGPCDAAIRVYYHNAQTGKCEPATYGGCQGNENRFPTMQACEQACDVVPTGDSCEVDGVTYPDGSGNVPDPFSCNTCSCKDGDLDICTEIGCAEECPNGSAPGQDCASCGPTDACLSVRTGCLPTCDTSNPCSSGLCMNGLCKDVCG